MEVGSYVSHSLGPDKRSAVLYWKVSRKSRATLLLHGAIFETAFGWHKFWHKTDGFTISE